MDDGVTNSNFESGAFHSGDVLESAPPPPSEVKVRTMRSDLASMAKTGGGLPSFENVKVSGLAATARAEAAARQSAGQPSSAPAQSGAKQGHLILILVLIILAIVAVAGWFAYTVFFNNQQFAQNQAPVMGPATSSNAVNPTTTSAAAPVPTLNLGAASTTSPATTTASQ